MIVATEDDSQRHLATGVWGRVALDQLVAKTATATPDRIAVADFADRADWTSGAARTLTYGELHQRSDALAAFFAGVGLSPDMVVAIQMPPTTDAIAVMLACFKAGLIVLPLPLALREADVIEAIEASGAKAIATVAQTENELHGERMRNVASEVFQIRFVFGAGGDVPDGLIDLERVYEEAASLGPAPVIQRKGIAADHCATLSLHHVLHEPAAGTEPAEAKPQAGVPLEAVPRSHNHWIATGLMTLLEARIEPAATIVCPFALTSLEALGGAFMPWLLAGGTLVLGMPRSTDRIAEEAASRQASHVLVPASFARRVAERLDAHKHEAALIVVGRTADDPALPRGTQAVDLVALGEHGLVARRRSDPATPVALPIGAIGAPAGTSMAPTLIETRIQGQPQRASRVAASDLLAGELHVRGAMVPTEAWPPRAPAKGRRPRSEDGFVATGVTARVVQPHPAAAELTGRVGEIARIGAADVDLDQLDRLFIGVAGVLDAAAIVVHDQPGGARIAAAVVPKPGVAFDTQGYLAALADARIGLHKMPARVYTVPAIARGPSGRVLRAGMAQHLAARG